MTVYLDLAPFMKDPVVPDDKGGSFDPHVFSSIHRFLPPYIECLRQQVFRIAQQRKIELVLLSERRWRDTGSGLTPITPA